MRAIFLTKRVKYFSPRPIYNNKPIFRKIQKRGVQNYCNQATEVYQRPEEPNGINVAQTHGMSKEQQLEL
jgi:hypothetical protein